MKHTVILSNVLELPAMVRGNDWWESSIVESWKSTRSANVFTAKLPRTSHDWAGRITEAMMTTGEDPFLGTERRHVFREDESVADLAAAAASDALTAAGIAAASVDFLLIHDLVPDWMHSIGNGPLVHAALGLRSDCRTAVIDGGFNSFLQQLDFADALLSSGRGQCGLLVQTAAASRVMRKQDQVSVLYGDAVSAQVVATTERNEGVLASAHFTDGTVHGGVVTTVPNKRWFEDGVASLHARDRTRAQQMLLSTGDITASVARRAMAAADVEPGQIDFFAGHQATAWLQAIMKDAAGVPAAKHVCSFATTGSLSSVNLPAELFLAAQRRELRAGSLVLLCSGSPGQVASSIVYRWNSRP